MPLQFSRPDFSCASELDIESATSPVLQVIEKGRSSFGDNVVLIDGPQALWWLLSLRPGDWRSIYWPQDLHAKYGSWFSGRWNLKASSSIEEHVDLCLGCIFNGVAHPAGRHGTPTIFWFLGSQRQWSLQFFPEGCQKVHTRNIELGGALHGCNTYFLLRGFGTRVGLNPPTIRRTLRFALDFSLMGSKTPVPGQSYLSPDSTPKLQDLHLEVALPHFGGGTKVRALQTSELSSLFHFPLWLSDHQLTQLMALGPPPLLNFSWFLDCTIPCLPHHQAIGVTSLPVLPSRLWTR